MITLYQLAEQCEKVLNAQVDKLDGFIDNTSFKFVIHVNEGEFKKASRNTTPITVTEANRVTYHINAIMKCIASNFDGDYMTLDNGDLNKGDDMVTMISAEMSTSIEFLIPFPSVTNSEGETLGETIYKLISEAYQQGWSGDMTDDDGECFLVGTRFTIPTPNVKDIRALVGESLPVTVYGDHFFVSEGVNSNKIKINYLPYGDDKYAERIFALRTGIARRSETDPNIFSSDPSTKNMILGTSLSIAFDIIFNTGTFSKLISNYLVNGVQPGSGDMFSLIIPGANVKNYKLIFSEAGLNAQIGTVASASVVMVEAL